MNYFFNLQNLREIKNILILYPDSYREWQTFLHNPCEPCVKLCDLCG